MTTTEVSVRGGNTGYEAYTAVQKYWRDHPNLRIGDVLAKTDVTKGVYYSYCRRTKRPAKLLPLELSSFYKDKKYGKRRKYKQRPITLTNVTDPNGNLVVTLSMPVNSFLQLMTSNTFKAVLPEVEVRTTISAKNDWVVTAK